MPRDILTMDGECFYGDDYTLSRMTTENFLRDPRFEPIMWGLKWNDTQAFWIHPGRADHYFRHEVDWANTTVLMHHAHFDAAWLYWNYGARPAFILDTLSMARVIDGPKAGNSLHDLCIRHGIGEKGDYVTFAKNKHYADFSADEIRLYGQYNVNDVEKTYLLGQKFIPLMPAHELELIDLTVRMFTEPVFVGDAVKLRGAVEFEQRRKKELLTSLGHQCAFCNGAGVVPDLISITVACKKCEGLGIDKKPFGSSDKFADLLRAAGVEPATKTSPTTGKQIYAFARTDAAMQSLLDDESESVSALAAARLAVKSNIIETRAERFQHMAENGAMPVYIKYGAAHTFRWGGGDSTNWQNLSGHNETRPEMSVIKASVGAPEGQLCVRTDSSQGEARIVAWNAEQVDLLNSFRRNLDVYSEHASTIYGRHVDGRNVKDDFICRQVGKIGILSFGFGAGYYTAAIGFLKGVLGAPPIQFKEADMLALRIDPSRFLHSPKKVNQVAAMPSRLGLNDRLIHCIVCEYLVRQYRTRYPMIPAYWKKMDRVIDAMIRGEELVFGVNGCMRAAKDKIWMPNGLPMNYHGISRSEDGEASYFDGRNRVRLHGPMLTENTTQALHRIIVGEQVLEISKVLKVGLITHDDATSVVPISVAEHALQFMQQCMKKVPAWAAGLPMISEGKIGRTLLDVK